MSGSDKKSQRAAKRSAADGRKSRSAHDEDANGKNDAAFTIGLADFARISAVEGLHLSAEMKRMFHEFDRQSLSAEERRRPIVAKYGKQPAS